MKPAEWLAVAAVLTVLSSVLPLIRGLALRAGTTPEVARKAVHVAMGSTCLAYPWIFGRPGPVWVLTAIVTVLLGVLRGVPSLRTGIGSAMHGIKRLSYGEVLFAPAVAAVFQGARGDLLTYVIPIAVLTVSDAASALAGTRWGRRRYDCGDGFKTVVGSTFFLVTAFVCVFAPLACSGRVGLGNALWIGLILATLTMMAEGISDRGFDNLVVPLGCFFMLECLLPLDPPALAGRFAAAALLLALVLAGSRWSTLSGGALLGGALLGYVCAVFADWRFTLPLAAVFVHHVVTTRKFNLVTMFDHRLDAVLAHAIGSLPWVILAAGGSHPKLTCLAGLSFAMATQLAMLEATTLSWLWRFPPQPMRSLSKGWLIAALPGLLWFWPDYGRLWLPLGVAVVSSLLTTLLFQWARLRYHGHVTWLWLFEGLLALASSLPALLIHP